MIEKCNREAKSISSSGMQRKKYKDYASFNDHKIFEGLDNSEPLGAEQLKNETHKDIFLGYATGGPG
jgi:hypothetical protein